MANRTLTSFYLYSYFFRNNCILHVTNSISPYADFKIHYHLSSYNYMRWLHKWYVTKAAGLNIHFFFKSAFVASSNMTVLSDYNLFSVLSTTICSKRSMSDNLTISKGPMARKKLSREQYAIKRYKTFVCLFVKFNCLNACLTHLKCNAVVLQIANYFFKKTFFKFLTCLSYYFGFCFALNSLFKLETPLNSILRVSINWRVTDSYFFFLN